MRKQVKPKNMYVCMVHGMVCSLYAVVNGNENEPNKNYGCLGPNKNKSQLTMWVDVDKEKRPPSPQYQLPVPFSENDGGK